MTTKKLFLALLAVALFAVGLVLSGMTQPAKIIGFLNVAGLVGPALASVLTGALGALVFVATLAAGTWAAVRFTS